MNILAEDFQIVYAPTFMDAREIPQVDISIVEGGVRTNEEETLIREIRAKSDILAAIGLCATHGGVTSFRDQDTVKQLLEKQYSIIDSTFLPQLSDFMYPIEHFVDVDYYITGCPPMVSRD